MLAPLVIAGGFLNVLNQASTRNMGDEMGLWSILLVAAFIGPISGLISLYVYGALIGWTGKWLGGKAYVEDIRAAIAWANVPAIWLAWVWLVELPVFGNEMFTSATPRIDQSLPLALLLIGLSVIEVVVGIWAVILYLRALGQVQQFSAWKALLNSLLAGAVVIVPILAISLLVFGASRM